jgi:N,N-dimethylformamidase beta subunit-like, C-terminal
MNIAFLGANAMFRRTRLDDRLVVCYKSSYAEDPRYGVDNTLVTSDWRDAPDPAPESSVIGTSYEGYPVDASYLVTAAGCWPFKNTGIQNDTGFAHLVGVEYDRVNPAYPVPRPIQVLAHSPLTCNGAASYADTAYYTHSGGAGVFNTGTMRWVEAIYGDQPRTAQPR